MKPATFKALALLLWAFSTSVAASRSSDAVARTWLRDHQDPAHSGDDLEELRRVNPDAFAIVKSLLMKRQLGLLDPKHPSHRFGSAPVDEDTGVASAPVDGPIATQSLSSPTVSGTMDKPQRNWLNWKPDSAANDEAMVKSVLGAVAEFKGAKPAGTMPVADAAASSDTVAPQSEVRPDVPQQQNSYLKALEGQPQKHKVHPARVDSDTWAVKPAATVAPHPKPKHENSYLKAIVPDSEKGPHDYLASFSWDDEDQKPAKAVAATQARAEGERGFNGSDTVAPQSEVRPDVPQQQNSYLKALEEQPQKHKVHPVMADSDTADVKPAATAAPHTKPKHENSYLKAIGFKSDIQKGPRDYLASFSWDEDQKPAKAVAAHRHALRANVASMPEMPSATLQAPHDSSLLTWLGGSKISKAPVKRLQKKPTQKPEPENNTLQTFNESSGAETSVNS
eukprot:CAMPEP_0172930190 /NCGR_PEP_ID=MMETSP1075-20121228/218864_1 /TAXON_ID=2916 /ORGANISM="Ceratium fusus, Strain PA161109" /LENGTH=450 /DNA_ID=CAMNT_0013791499 /DNA_START=9 /DNA_END=1358 /DNA_ORIENTATION=-